MACKMACKVQLFLNFLNALLELQNISAVKFQGIFLKPTVNSPSFYTTKHPFCCLPKLTPCSFLFSAGVSKLFCLGTT